MENLLTRVFAHQPLVLEIACLAGLNAASCASLTSSTQGSGFRKSLEAVAQCNRLRSVYVFGGQTSDARAVCTAERFDISERCWRAAPRMPTRRTSCAAIAHGGFIYVCGGADAFYGGSLATMDRFDVRLNSWKTLEPMSVARPCCSGAALEGSIYVCGGWSDDGAALATVERYCVEEEKWETAPGMRVGRAYCAAVVLKHALYIYGGEDADGCCLDDVECFDNSSGRWKTKHPMPSRRAGIVAATLKDIAFVCGGWNNDGQSLANVDQYVPESDSWTPAPFTRICHECGAAATDGMSMYVFGGTSSYDVSPRTYFHVAEFFTIDSNEWFALPSMRIGRGCCSATYAG